MTQAGGPAAINGFLYQILHHIEWIASVRLEGADQEVKNALLVLEPRNGGDAQAEAPDQYLVEQYKTRANGTWALTDVETILRDLRKAVPPSLPDNALYRFVTDGRDGRLSVFKAFLDALNSTGKCNRLGSWHRKGQLVYFPWPFQTQLPTEALMGTYHQLTEHQRYQIYALKKAGHSQQSIAATVAVSPSTICRELRRNQGQRGYRPGQAHHKALARRRHKAKATKMTAAVIERIEAGLGQQWSPEQIAGRLATTDGFRLSPQRIYQHIQADRQAGGMLYRHLRHSQKKRKKRYGKADARGQIKGRISIDQRPAIVEEKSRIGDWEIDLVMGRARTGALVSVVERRSRYTVLGKVPSKQAEHVAAATIALLAAHKGHTQTITADNGKEFAHHATISQALDAAVYFAHPYHAWERGLNENTNGLIRQYVPKGTALDTLSQAQVHHIMERLNHRPRKGLAFQTPHEILCKETEVQPKQGEIALTS